MLHCLTLRRAPKSVRVLDGVTWCMEGAELKADFMKTDNYECKARCVQYNIKTIKAQRAKFVNNYKAPD